MALDGFTDAYTRSDKMAADLLTPAAREGFLEEDSEGPGRPFIYSFYKKPTHEFGKKEIPDMDLEMLKYEYGDYQIEEPVKRSKDLTLLNPPLAPGKPEDSFQTQ